jgi:histidinol-phosphate aminotransferase
VTAAVMRTAGERVRHVRRYRPGRPAPATPAGKLSSNEAPLGASPAVRRAIAGAAAEAHTYADGRELREQLAAGAGVPADRVVLSSGSDELCYLLATLFVEPGAKVVASDPCYAIDELVTRVHLGEPCLVPLAGGGVHDLEAMAAEARDAAVVWLPSPHNPTGGLADAGALEAFLDRVPPACLVVLDEAYRDFADAARRPDVHQLLGRFPNLVVQRTLSKAYALAGLRVGYGIGAADVIDALESIRPPFNVNAVALAAARAALAEPAWHDYTVGLVVRERIRFEAWLTAAGIPFHPSQANFVTIRPPHVERLHAALAERGVVVRDGADLGLPGWVRISIGAPPQMALVREALHQQQEAA